uniref:Bacteriophage abortive infection AbiH n=1 Tax=Candidatus Kentrum eta TaxID=2126337 RepID=A0A450U580_9GAMM|nr:MAG: Bacteriophage abortive infection AbiH [Candidatus Kentron sp. H]VFJ95350.1 MAG: Bacteriophage abortive infection AbiH [Candidatus Kentron sp. H]VFK01158.1 MAG: Bacteriophage abortive infection AbiH [Candidatus Kentron sp. H]
MSKKTLYIIGNGFDIYHGVSSQYSDFKEYLSNEDSSLHDIVEKFIPVQEDWSDLEDALADIDVDNVVDNASQFLMSYGAEDWSDAYHHDYQREVYRIIESLSISLKECFGEWVRQLEIPTLKELSVHPLSLPITARYLTFNYTSSLTDIYAIPRNSIFHIHGEARKDQELVLGHAWNPIEIPSLNNVPDPDSMDTRVMEGDEIINDYFRTTFKNSRKIIAENSVFFQSLTGVSKIIVLGHSLSQVDEAYFKEIVENVDINNVRWVVTYHRDPERDRHQDALINIGIPENAISLITFGAIPEVAPPPSQAVVTPITS